jgi:predicted DNA-binding transcriptional regulator AlpA
MTDQTPVQQLLTVAEVAKLLGVQEASVRKYASLDRSTGKRRMPAPDGHLGRTPYWYPATVEAWQASRPGQGVGGGRPRRADTPA